MGLHQDFYQALHELNPKVFPVYELQEILDNPRKCLGHAYIDKWNYAAFNKDGSAGLFVNKPEIVGDIWKDPTSIIRKVVFITVPFTGDWTKSLIERKK